MKNITKYLALLLALVMVLCLAACGGNDAAESAAPAEDAASDAAPAEEAAPENDAQSFSHEVASEAGPFELTMGLYSDTTYCSTFDPTGALSGARSAGYGTGYCLYDTLFYLDQDGGYRSLILESYSWDEAGTTFTGTLRDGITFANGEALTGEDILWTLGYVQNSGMRSGYYKPYIVEKSSWEGNTITLVTEKPYAFYQGGLDFFILDKSYVEEKGAENIDWFDPAQVNGSGPYKAVEYVQESYTVYELRDDYWGIQYGFEFPYSKITAKYYTDQTTLAIDLQTGAIDLATNLAVTDYDAMAASAGDVSVGLIDGKAVYTLVYDLNNNENLKDINLRLALNEIVNLDDLTYAVAGSFGKPATSVLGQGELGYKATGFEYNPDHAKELAAAYNGSSLNMLVMASAPQPAIAEILQAYYAELGITLNIESVEFATFISQKGIPGASDLTLYCMTGGNASGDPSMHLDNWKTDSTDPIMMRDASYEELINGAASTLDTNARIELYQQLQDKWHDNVDALGLYEYSVGYGWSNEVFPNGIALSSTSAMWIFGGFEGTIQ